MLGPLLITGFSILIYSIHRYYRFVARFPKGPRPLPFIGNIFEMDFKAQHRTYERFAKKYGGIFTIFTPIPYVQINDFEIMREAFIENGEEFVMRPSNKVFQEAINFAPNAGVAGSNGDNWREQRRTALSILRDFGMGKNVMEEMVRSSVADYIEHLHSIADKENVDMHKPVQLMIANIINETLFGFRYTHDDCAPLMVYVKTMNQRLDDLAGSRWLLLGFAFPFLTQLPVIGWYTLGQFKQAIAEMNVYIVNNVERILKAKIDEGDEPTNFVQAYKQRMNGNEYLNKANLLGSCADFFFAGQETTTTTLRWAMLILAKQGEIQEKLRNEILCVVGKDRLPTMADQPKMIYARACILELQRFANIISVNGPRVTARDVEIRGVTIPEGAWVNGDIHYMMAKAPVFENPNEFRPERYIDEDGKTLRKDLVERTIPFSIGKRACAGEALARVELFLGLTATFQHFSMSPRPGENIDLEPIPGDVIRPRSQQLCIRAF